MTKVGFLARLSKIGSGITRRTGLFGDYVAKFKVGASRSSYYQSKNTFKTAKSYGKENENIAMIVAGDSNSIIDEVYEGTMDIKEAKGRIAQNLDEAGYTGGAKSGMNIDHRLNLAQNIIDHGMQFTRQSNRVRRYATAGGTLTILGVGVVVGGAIADWINSKLGGILDGLLNPASESNLGSMIVLGVVVIGSVYILNTTKQILGS